MSGVFQINKAGTFAPALYDSPFLFGEKTTSRLKTLEESREFDLLASRPPTDSAYGAPLGQGGGLLLLRAVLLEHR